MPMCGDIRYMLETNKGLKITIYLVNNSNGNQNERILSFFDKDDKSDKHCLDRIKFVSNPNESLCMMVYNDIQW